MKKVIVCVIVLLSVLGAHAQDGMLRLPYPCVYWTQPGDTLMGIAGSHFVEVYENNLEELTSHDLSGKPSPNRIVSGTRLRLPSGIWVSSRVARAINTQAATRQKALSAIDQADKGRIALRTLNGSSPGGGALLEEAKRLAEKEPGYANANYLQAYEKAILAEKYFADAMAIVKLQAELQEVEKKLELQARDAASKETISGAATMSYLRWPGLAVLAALLVLLGGICLFWARSRLRQRDPVSLYVRQRLAHHKNRLAVLSHPIH